MDTGEVQSSGKNCCFSLNVFTLCYFSMYNVSCLHRFLSSLVSAISGRAECPFFIHFIYSCRRMWFEVFCNAPKLYCVLIPFYSGGRTINNFCGNFIKSN